MTLELRPVRHLRERTDEGVNIQHPSEESASGFLGFAAFVIGVSVLPGRAIPIEVFGLSPVFLIGFAFAALGWWTGVTEPIFRRYLHWATAFAAVAVLSLVVNDIGGLARSGLDILWFLLIPGTAALLQQPRLFRSMWLGLLTGSGLMLLVVVLRVAAGLPAADGVGTHLLGVNRNAVDMCVVWLLPAVAISRTLRVSVFVRWGYIFAAILWLVSSKGRTGLIGLGLAPLLVFALTPPKGGGSRFARAAVIVAVGGLIFTSMGAVRVSWLPALTRIERVENEASRSQSDEIRILLGKKAQAIGAKHPVTGVGFGQFEGQYDPILDTAKTRHIREKAAVLPSHNTYLDALATTGYGGFLLFIGLLGTTIAAGIRRSRDPDVRAMTAGLVIISFAIAFHTGYLLLVAPLSLTLAAIANADRRERDAASMTSDA